LVALEVAGSASRFQPAGHLVGRILAGLANLQSEPHGDGVGPRRSEWCANLGNANIAHPTIERGAIDGHDREIVAACDPTRSIRPGCGHAIAIASGHLRACSAVPQHQEGGYGPRIESERQSQGMFKAATFCFPEPRQVKRLHS